VFPIFVELYRLEPQTVDLSIPTPSLTSTFPVIRAEFREMVESRPGVATRRWIEFVSAQCAEEIVELTESELACAQAIANWRFFG
jgi:hypothetical protein